MTAERPRARNSTLLARMVPVRRTGVARTPFPAQGGTAVLGPAGQRGSTLGRDTGPDDATRKLVLERDWYRCVCCGKSITGRRYSLQHRKRRSQGGDNSPSNLVLLCGAVGEPGSCRDACDWRSPEMEDRGFWLCPNEDPALIPVVTNSPTGSQLVLWLTPEGTYGFEVPRIDPPGGTRAARGISP